MKTPFLPLLLLGFLAACDPLGDRLPGIRLRSECGPHRPPDGQPKYGTLRPDSLRLLKADTTLLFCAIRFPEGYDWQRDTAYGSVPFDLLLYKDFEPVLTLPSGPDACFVPDPDRHHLLSGHLYTERMADGTTRIGRDGTELFRFTGREYLVGLLEDGEDLYTLSRPAKGPGFTYRKNGYLLLNRADGTPFGDLSDPSYGATGALYRDQGRICFCFSAGTGGGRAGFAVLDGVESRLDALPAGALIRDLKMRKGEPRALLDTLRGYKVCDGRLWPEGTGSAVTGSFSLNGEEPYSGYLEPGLWGAPERVCPEEAALYRVDRKTFAVSADEAGSVCWYGPGGGGREDLPCHFLTPACAGFTGGFPWLVLTPRDTRRRPFVRAGTRVREVDVYGYISCLSVTVSFPARKASGSHPDQP